MIKQLIPSLALLSVLLVTSCTSSRLAQDTVHDDVYYSVAQAKEAPERTEMLAEEAQPSENSDYNDDFYSEEEYSDGEYAARIRRFHRYSPWRSYYDFYDPFDPFYNHYSYRYPYYRPGLSLSFNFGYPYYDPFFYGHRYYGYGYGYGYPHYGYGYGSPYYGYGYGNRLGLYSYYNSYPGYYGGIGRTYYASPNYRPRPSRDFDNIYSSPTRPGSRGSVRPDGRVIDTRTRAERYGEGRSSGSYPSNVRSTRPETSSGARPSRTDVSRPSRSSGTPARTSGSSSRGQSSSSRPTRTERYTPPPAPPATSERSSSGSSSSPSRSSSGSSSGRPSRGN